MTRKPTANTPKPTKSKKQRVIDQLSSKSGTTMEGLQKLTGWQRHTVRAMLSTLRKNGFTIEADKRTDKPTVYRITAASEFTKQPQASSTETAAS